MFMQSSRLPICQHAASRRSSSSVVRIIITALPHTVGCPLNFARSSNRRANSLRLGSNSTFHHRVSSISRFKRNQRTQLTAYKRSSRDRSSATLPQTCSYVELRSSRLRSHLLHHLDQLAGSYGWGQLIWVYADTEKLVSARMKQQPTCNRIKVARTGRS